MNISKGEIMVPRGYPPYSCHLQVKKMKVFHIGALVLLVALMFATVPVQALSPGQDFNGPHYNLNIIGVPKDKTADVPAWTNENRHTMFVPLDKKTNIYMTNGSDFAVLDANGCDGTARFQLGEGLYEVYAVALGKPNGNVTITPNATYTVNTTGETVFYLGNVELSHSKKPSWERVTGLFLATVTLDTNNDGIGDTTYNNQWIFNIPELLDYWWDYNNHGCKLTQVRFYPVEAIPEIGS